MNELLIEVRNQLNTCNLAGETRLSLMNINNPNEFLVCFLLLSDRYENFEELANAITNCLSNMNVIMSRINNSRITIRLA